MPQFEAFFSNLFGKHINEINFITLKTERFHPVFNN